MSSKTGISRRDFVKSASGLLIGFSLIDSSIAPEFMAAAQRGAVTDPKAARLDAWLRVQPDGIVRVFTGKVDVGVGLETALAQIVAEELDLSPDRVVVVMGDTSVTTDQGGTSASSSIAQGARPLRNAAAAARVLLMQLASRRFGTSIDELQVRNGIINVKGDPSKTVSYGDLAGSMDPNETLKVSGNGGGVNVEGPGKPKDPSTYTVVGQPLPRLDLPAKIFGRFQYITDVRVPGMLHGRIIRPASVGAKLVHVDEDSVKGIPGYVKIVVTKDFVGVVAENEWAAVRAAKALKVTWSAPIQAFPEQKELYEHLRSATPKASRETLKHGDPIGALANAAKKLEARYDFPFQSHSPMDPGCAVADVHMDGLTTVWSGGQKPHYLQKGYAELLGVPLEKVRVIWVEDAGSYGRPGYEDTGADAVLLSQAMGRPVRVQWMRADMTAWGRKGPAASFDVIAGLDEKGGVTAVQFTSRAFSAAQIHFLPQTAGNYLASELIGMPITGGADEFIEWGNRAPAYAFENLQAVAHVVAGFHDDGASSLGTTHMRDPNGPATTFAVESFMDELAAVVGTDPIEFRFKYMNDVRARAVLTAAAEKAGWDTRPSPKKSAGTGDIVAGRSIALGVRNGTYIGTVAEVEVNRRTGAVRVTRLVCAHDCGLIVNPLSLRGVIAGNLVQSMSRTLKEEVLFDRNNVTSMDWIAYPVARWSDVPAQVDIVLLNHPEIAPSGAGEPSSRPTPAAIANAIFDATGVRLRQVPFTPVRVKAALSSA